MIIMDVEEHSILRKYVKIITSILKWNPNSTVPSLVTSSSNWSIQKRRGNLGSPFSHKVVLAGNSAYFRDLLRSPRFKNEKRIRVEVPDVLNAHELLHWMYTRELTPPAYLASIANMWSITELSEFNSPEFSDVILDLVDPTGNERTLFSHKVILAGYSEFFRRLFLTRFRESWSETN